MVLEPVEIPVDLSRQPYHNPGALIEIVRRSAGRKR
jgi:hypothetical protein